MKGIFAILYTIVNLIFAPFALIRTIVNIVVILAGKITALMPTLLSFLPTSFLVLGIALTALCIVMKIFNR